MKLNNFNFETIGAKLSRTEQYPEQRRRIHP